MGTPSKRRREGRKAYDNGYGLEDNPYPKTAVSGWEDWKEGWKEADEIAEALLEEPPCCPYCGRPY